MTRIVSSVRGRIRVRDKRLRDRVKLDAFIEELGKLTAITSIQDNVRTGSVLLFFDWRTIERPELEADIDAIADKVIGKQQMPSAWLSKKNLSRYNKIAMLASLGTSLFALKMAGRKRRIGLHKLTGYLFVANLGVHLLFYRKALRRTFSSRK